MFHPQDLYRGSPYDFYLRAPMITATNVGQIRGGVLLLNDFESFIVVVVTSMSEKEEATNVLDRKLEYTQKTKHFMISTA